jgi:SAM-dependent methyltransferase
MHTTTYFDDRAQTWDADPAKIERAVAVAEGIRNQVPLSPQMRALEYGCGTGLLGFALQPYLGDITLADSSPGMLAVLTEKIAAAGATNLHPMKLDLVSDPLPPERYDLICSLLTFHHVADIDRLLRGLFSLAASPGYLCVADLDTEDGSFHGAGFDGHQGFDREDLGRRAKQAGFRDVTFTTAFQIAKGNGPGQTEFPVFLMVARKV